MSEQNKKLKVWAGSLDKQQMKYFIDFIKDAGYDHTLIFKHEINNYDFQSGETIAALRGWNAATAEANKLIEALEGEVAELKHDRNEWYKDAQEKRLRILELQAHINDLREALEENHYSNSTEKAIKLYKEALSKTPAQSLQAFENEVIEKCAKVCEENFKPFTYDAVAEAIRALKEVK